MVTLPSSMQMAMQSREKEDEKEGRGEEEGKENEEVEEKENLLTTNIIIHVHKWQGR